MSHRWTYAPARRSWLSQRQSFLLALGCAVVLQLAAIVWSAHNDMLLAYGDAQSHLEIARRVFDSRTPSFAQLGTVWLPVPHLLLMPFVYIDPLWHSGLAGSLVGLVCLAGAAAWLFLLVREVTRRDVAAWIALGILVTNPNVLYVCTTALTEPVLLATMTGATYYLYRWGRDGRYPHLMAAGLLTALAIGSRYDGWFYAAAGAACVAVAALGTRSVARGEAAVLTYLAVPAYTMFLWILYNWLIFGDPLAFQRGEHSAQAQ